MIKHNECHGQANYIVLTGPKHFLIYFIQTGSDLNAIYLYNNSKHSNTYNQCAGILLDSKGIGITNATSQLLTTCNQNHFYAEETGYTSDILTLYNLECPICNTEILNKKDYSILDTIYKIGGAQAVKQFLEDKGFATGYFPTT